MRAAIILALALAPIGGTPSPQPDSRAAAASRHAATLASRGIYTNCAACHGAMGTGGIGPALVGDQHLAVTPYAVTMVLTGTHTMPGFAAALNDAQVAQVLTAVRSQWGNNFGPVTAAQVAEQRQALAAPAADPMPGR